MDAEAGNGSADEVVRRGTAVAGQMTEVVRTEASQLGDEAAHQLRSLVDDVQAQVEGQAERELERLAASVDELGARARALAEGRPEDAGPLVRYVEQGAERATMMADRLRRRGWSGLSQDVDDFARRRPVAFLTGTALAGVLVGRYARAQRARASHGGAGVDRPADARVGQPLDGAGYGGAAAAARATPVPASAAYDDVTVTVPVR